MPQGVALPIPRRDILTVGFNERWNVPINKQDNPCYAYTYEIPVDTQAWTSLYTMLKTYTHMRVKSCTIQIMPPTSKAVAYAAFSNADSATSVSSSTYADFFDHMDDWIYTRKGSQGAPVSLSRTFNNLPWVPIGPRAGNNPIPTVAVCGAWYDGEGTKAQGSMRTLISIEVYGSANR